MQEHTFTVPRTARYYTLGTDQGVRELWIVLHGYGQLARYFLRHFRAIEGDGRLVVAPEGLSRFYLELGERRVGAAWMTREARLGEIDDYVRYLDAVLARVQQEAGAGETPVTLLGFSQGAQTACRWAAFGEAFQRRPPARLVLWGGGPPDDLDMARHARALAGLTLVVGDEDDYATPERVAAVQARLDDAGLDYRFVPFPGGHHLDADVLRRLVDDA